MNQFRCGSGIVHAQSLMWLTRTSLKLFVTPVLLLLLSSQNVKRQSCLTLLTKPLFSLVGELVSEKITCFPLLGNIGNMYRLNELVE